MLIRIHRGIKAIDVDNYFYNKAWKDNFFLSQQHKAALQSRIAVDQKNTEIYTCCTPTSFAPLEFKLFQYFEEAWKNQHNFLKVPKLKMCTIE